MAFFRAEAGRLGLGRQRRSMLGIPFMARLRFHFLCSLDRSMIHGSVSIQRWTQGLTHRALIEGSIPI